MSSPSRPGRVVETIGPPTLERSIRSLAFGGEIAMVGVFGGHIGSIGQDSSDAPMPDARLSAGHLYTVRSIPVGSRTGLDEVARFIAEHDLHPVIDSVYDFADARETFRHPAD